MSEESRNQILEWNRVMQEQFDQQDRWTEHFRHLRDTFLSNPDNEISEDLQKLCGILNDYFNTKMALFPCSSRSDAEKRFQSLQFLHTIAKALDDSLKLETYKRGDERVVIAIGPFAWGIAQTVTEAVKNCKSNISNRSPKREYTIVVYSCPRGSYVNEMGGINHWPDRGPVHEIDRITIKK